MSRSPAQYLHPRNALTYGSLLAGLLAVFAAGEFALRHAAGALLAASVLLDAFDGRFARLFSRTKDEAAFGVQLDSLADAAVFGLAPVACLYLVQEFGASPLSRLGWAAAGFAYLVSALTRLGCFNLHQAGAGHFVGIPTTLAALVLTTLLLWRTSPAASGVALFACALGMLAPLRVPRPRGAALFVFVAWAAGVLALHVLGIGREIGFR
jgi:CDP-diacylglycerol---serine O-phosphatidyltransferase